MKPGPPRTDTKGVYDQVKKEIEPGTSAKQSFGIANGTEFI